MEYSLDQVFFPPVGIAHISRRPADLIGLRAGAGERVCFYIASQPNSHPHIGTIINIFVAFALAAEARAGLRLGWSGVLFDVLDNGPASTVDIDGTTYFKSLKDTIENGRSRADVHWDSFELVLEFARRETEIPLTIRRYADFQSHPVFRQSLIDIFNRYDSFSRILDPIDGRIRLRFPCPICKYADKTAKTLKVLDVSASRVVFEAVCWMHGAHRVLVTPAAGDFVDANTSLRSLLKCAVLIEDQATLGVPVMVDGADWSGPWWQLICVDGFSKLGRDASQLPLSLFSPMILDWSGAKFSKSLYLRQGAYAYLPKAYVDVREFLTTYGDDGLRRLWSEVQSWVRDPRRMFRNYSVHYLGLILG